jgi:nucleoid-associated protein YgaU
MASWTPPERPSAEERPWLGLAMLALVGFLTLLLLRLLWSGTGVWYLVVGLLLVGGAAVAVFTRTQRGTLQPAARPVLAGSRLPLLLAGAGALLLVLLLVPTTDSGESEAEEATSPVTVSTPVSSVAAVAVTPAAVATPAQGGAETYVVESGDTLWDIAERFGTTVDALVEANGLEDAADLTVGQQLTIPESTQ